MRIVFLGMTELGAACLREVILGGGDVVGVYTVDDDYVAASGMHPSYFGNYAALARQAGLPLYRVRDITAEEHRVRLRDLRPDLVFAIGWSQIIPPDLLALPARGFIGLHPAPLPERRGAASINWSLIDGLGRSAATMLYLAEGIDDGDIIAQKEFLIGPTDTARDVLNTVNRVGADMMRQWYPRIAAGVAPRQPQDHAAATYTPRRRPEDGRIHWRSTSWQLFNFVRALSLPYPGAFTIFQDRRLTVWRAELVRGVAPPRRQPPGRVLEIWAGRGLLVKSADYCLLLTQLQWEGEEPLPADECARRLGVAPGDQLGVVSRGP